MSSNNKQKISPKRTVIISACVVAAALLLIALIYNLAMIIGTNVRANRLQAQIDKLAQDIASTESDIEHRKTPEYIEQILREYYGYKKDGEIVYR